MMKLPCVYPILDTSALASRGAGLRLAAEAFLEGGAGILQIRHKGHWNRSVFREAEEVSGLCRQYGAILIIDDRADIAMLLEAGLHVGQDDLPPREARRLIGDAILGYSSHNPRQLCEAGGEPVDYVALGPIFPTVSKQNPDPVVGLDQLRDCRGLVTKPLVAIGGITRENARDVLAAGADAVAVIGDLLPEPATAFALRQRMEEWRQLTSR